MIEKTTIEDLYNKARAFYNGNGIELKDEDINLAVQSLTMPQYAHYCKQNLKIPVEDHRSLATLGDAYIDSYILREAFSLNNSNNAITSERLTALKQSLSTNKNLNDIGEHLLKNQLNYYNNDLPDGNSEDIASKKAYATAVEAVIGFLFLRYPHIVDTELSKLIPKENIEQLISQI